VPDVRSDCRYRLALLFADICYLDALHGCTAGNEWFVTRLKKVAGEVLHPSTIKDLLALLKAAGLIEVSVAHGNDRVIRPLVPLAEVFQHWLELAQICVRRLKLPALVRAAARTAISQLMAGSRTPSLERLAGNGLASLQAENSAPPPPPTPRRFPLSEKEPKGERQQTEQVVSEPTPIPSADPAAVTLLRENGLPEPDAVSIAVEVTKNAWPLERVKQALRAARARGESLRNLGGFVRAALRGGWLPPAPPSSHPSDLGERPQRVVKALRPIPPDWLPGMDYEAARGFCNEAARLIRLEGTERPSDTEIRDRARLLWQREHPKEEPVWLATLR
jgi:hypothetical protein